MPANQSEERKGAMRAYGAELIDVTPEQGMEGARDLALAMQARGEGLVLNQFANPDNPAGTSLPQARRSGERVAELRIFVVDGNDGNDYGVSRFLNRKTRYQIIGLQPTDGSQIPGINVGPQPTCQISIKLIVSIA